MTVEPPAGVTPAPVVWRLGRRQRGKSRLLTVDREKGEKPEMAGALLLGMKNIVKPCAGKPHARFDEGGQAEVCSLLCPVFVLSN